MEPVKKLSLKKLTILSLDDASLVIGGGGEETKDPGGGDSYCEVCVTMPLPDSGCCNTVWPQTCECPTVEPTMVC